MTAVSAGLLLVTLAATACGLHLLAEFPRPPSLFGLLLILVGIELRPRIPRIRRVLGTITPAEAPATFAVIDRVAAQLGTHSPTVLHVDETFNAACGRSGLRRRPALVLGLSLWSALSPDARVALLGHELGHLANNDPRNGLLTQPALTTFYRLAYLLDPKGMVARRGPHVLRRLFGRLALGSLSRVCWRIHLLLCALAASDSRRAEYLADDLALRMGGTAGAVELVQTLVASDTVRTAVRRAAASGAAISDWLTAAVEARLLAGATLRLREQRSIRLDASTLASHPPSGLRSRVLAARAEQPPAISIEPRLWAESDAELAPHYERARRAMSNQ